MRFLISTDINSFRAIDSGSPHVYFCDPDSNLSAPLTGPETVDVWICHGKEVTKELVDQWLDRACHVQKSMLVRDNTAIPRLKALSNGRTAAIEAFYKPEDDAEQPCAESILRAAELLYVRGRVRADSAIRQQSMSANPDRKTNVLLVGAGIMNLVTAELLATRGFQVRIVDQGPDPRFCEDSSRLGVTSGGGNARMFTFTEADNYNEKGSEIYHNMQSVFHRTTCNGGWSVKPPSSFNSAERAWVDAFERLPAWLARAFKEDIYEVNRDAGELWARQMVSAPELFEGVTFREGILRMYVEPVALEAAKRLNRTLGAMVHETSLRDFLAEYPGFSAAAQSDELAGGFTVKGFTVNIHPFVANLIDRITRLGGTFTWDCCVQRMRRNVWGEIVMLESQLGNLEADHYVVSPGMMRTSLLEGTASGNLLQGVLGVWLQIPNLDPQMQHSMKIHRRGHLVEDINVTVAKCGQTGEDILMLGGGYGYVGLDRPAPENTELVALFNELEEVARIYFPRGYETAKERGELWPGGHRRFCIRPFTPTGLGLFEKIPTASGGHLIVTGGNNTGGFAQAPAVARAVWRALVGEHDPIHVLFHPDRGKLPSTMKSEAQISRPSLPTSIDTQPPLKLLLLCSNGSNHSYLRYRLNKAFPGYRCIMETEDGQLRHLIAKGRVVDAAYMGYHSLRRSIFGYDVQRSAHFKQLMPEGYVLSSPDLIVDSLNCRQVWDAVEQWQPDLTIVSGTKYIGRKLNERAGLMINLHVGHLPDYKGNHCIFFALYDGAVDKVAATLHQLTPRLDGGDILDIVFPDVRPTDNEETLYTRCAHMAIDRVIERAEQFSRGQKLPFIPQKPGGRMFRHRDRTPTKELGLWWALAVNGLLRKYPEQQDSSEGVPE